MDIKKVTDITMQVAARITLATACAVGITFTVAKILATRAIRKTREILSDPELREASAQLGTKWSKSTSEACSKIASRREIITARKLATSLSNSAIDRGSNLGRVAIGFGKRIAAAAPSRRQFSQFAMAGTGRYRRMIGSVSGALTMRSVVAVGAAAFLTGIIGLSVISPTAPDSNQPASETLTGAISSPEQSKSSPASIPQKEEVAKVEKTAAPDLEAVELAAAKKQEDTARVEEGRRQAHAAHQRNLRIQKERALAQQRSYAMQSEQARQAAQYQRYQQQQFQREAQMRAQESARREMNRYRQQMNSRMAARGVSW